MLGAPLDCDSRWPNDIRKMSEISQKAEARSLMLTGPPPYRLIGAEMAAVH